MLLYNSAVSGNCYKVRLLAAHLGLPLELHELSVVDRSNRREVLGDQPGLARADARPRRRPAAGRVERDPLVLRRRDRVRAERPLRARPGAPVAVLRAVPARADDRGRPLLAHLLGGAREARRSAIAGADAAAATSRSTRWSATSPARTFLVGERYSVADISLYAYTHVAARGRLRPRRLSRHPRVAGAGRRPAAATSRSTPEVRDRAGAGVGRCRA